MLLVIHRDARVMGKIYAFGWMFNSMMNGYDDCTMEPIQTEDLAQQKDSDVSR
jgi:hypothetical protein